MSCNKRAYRASGGVAHQSPIATTVKARVRAGVGAEVTVTTSLSYYVGVKNEGRFDENQPRFVQRSSRSGPVINQSDREVKD
jgi:hypothetical protein